MSPKQGSGQVVPCAGVDQATHALDQAPCGYLSTTADGIIVDVNATLCAWLGMRADDLVGRPVAMLMTIGGRLLYETYYAPMLRMGSTAREMAVDAVCADGSRLPVLMSAVAVRSPQGDPHRFHFAVFDATKRRAYERDLVRSRDQQQAELTELTEQAVNVSATVRQILDAATDTLLVATDIHLVVTHFSCGAQEMLGYQAEEMVGWPLGRLLGSRETQRHAAALGAPAELERLIPALVDHSASRDWLLPTKSGECTTVAMSITDIRDDDRLIGYLCAGTDMSARLNIEAAHEAALNRELDSMARLEDADRIKAQVVSTISHELRTPVTALQGYSELLADGSLGQLTPEQNGAVVKILRNAERLSALVDNLLVLDAAQATEDEIRTHLQPTSLTTLVSQMSDTIHRAALDRDVTLHLDLPEVPAAVFGHRPTLERLLLNLTENAVKFTPAGGSVTVALAATSATCVLTVADTGMGMSPEIQSRARERFFRASEAFQMAVPGLGLGLSVADAIVRAHAGTMDITSSPDCGTTVTVMLPAHQSRLHRSRAQASPPATTST